MGVKLLRPHIFPSDAQQLRFGNYYPFILKLDTNHYLTPFARWNANDIFRRNQYFNYVTPSHDSWKSMFTTL